MEYLITFLEGIISFVSPCMLPMLPVYVSYFSAGGAQKKHTLARALSFTAGFTLVFCAMGVFAGSVGAALTRYQTIVNLLCGGLVMLFGLSYLEIIPLPLFRGIQGSHEAGSVLSAFLFGLVYSVSLTPCVGAFLGSALMLAASVGGAGKGLALLLVYSLGLGIPFVLSALLLDRLAGAFSLLKKHYRLINTICGIFLILVGLVIAMGWMNRMLSVFS